MNMWYGPWTLAAILLLVLVEADATSIGNEAFHAAVMLKQLNDGSNGEVVLVEVSQQSFSNLMTPVLLSCTLLNVGRLEEGKENLLVCFAHQTPLCSFQRVIPLCNFELRILFKSFFSLLVPNSTLISFQRHHQLVNFLHHCSQNIWIVIVWCWKLQCRVEEHVVAAVHEL